MAATAPAHAQRVQVLTNENITKFINETTQIIAGHANAMSDEQIKTYLNQHLHPEARFKSVMKYIVPGYSPNEVAVSMNKDEFIQGIEGGEASLEKYDNQIKILSIKISDNKKIATVKSQNTESAMMKVAGDDEKSETVPVSGHSNCTQILAINKGTIQMYHASCVTDIEFVEGY